MTTETFKVILKCDIMFIQFSPYFSVSPHNEACNKAIHSYIFFYS